MPRPTITKKTRAESIFRTRERLNLLQNRLFPDGEIYEQMQKNLPPELLPTLTCLIRADEAPLIECLNTPEYSKIRYKIVG